VLPAAGGAVPSRLLSPGRDVGVARAVNHHGFSRGTVLEDAKPLSDAELHAMIADARKEIMNHRLDVFRKRKPTRKSKYTSQYKIAVAKTLLKERELEKANKEAAEAEPAEALKEEEEVFALRMTPDMSKNAYDAFHKRPGMPQQNKKNHNFPSTSSHPEDEEKQFAEFLEERKKDGTYEEPSAEAVAELMDEKASTRTQRFHGQLNVWKRPLPKRTQKNKAATAPSEERKEEGPIFLSRKAKARLQRESEN